MEASFILCWRPSHQVLYVMELRQDLEKGKASFTAVSEFLLTHPVLSFGVQDVSHCRLRHTEVLPAEEETESMTTGDATDCSCYIHIGRWANDVRLVRHGVCVSSVTMLPVTWQISEFGDATLGVFSDRRRLPCHAAPRWLLSMFTTTTDERTSYFSLFVRQ